VDEERPSSSDWLLIWTTVRRMLLVLLWIRFFAYGARLVCHVRQR
jgi:hypothetical protein